MTTIDIISMELANSNWLGSGWGKNLCQHIITLFLKNKKTNNKSKSKLKLITSKGNYKKKKKNNKKKCHVQYTTDQHYTILYYTTNIKHKYTYPVSHTHLLIKKIVTNAAFIYYYS